MFFDYLKERLGRESIVTEHGFIVYLIQKMETGNQFFVVDMYVKPESRSSRAANELLSKMYEIAKENQCKCMIATVDVNTNGATKALKFHLAHGGTIIKAEGGIIYTWKLLE